MRPRLLRLLSREGLTINNNSPTILPCAPTPSPHCRTPNVSGTLSSPCWIGFQARCGSGWRPGSPRSSDRCANGKEPNVSNIISELKTLHMRLGMLRGQVLNILDQYQNGSKPSPVKPRPRRQFNDDMRELANLSKLGTYARRYGRQLDPVGILEATPPDRERQEREATRPLRTAIRQELHERGYFSLMQELDHLLSENSSPAPAAGRTGPRSPKRATRARKVTSSKSTKRARSGKGGK